MSDTYRTIIRFRDGWAVLPELVMIDVPSDAYPDARALVDAATTLDADPDGNNVRGIFGIPRQPFPGHDRWDVYGVEMPGGRMVTMEVTRTWIRCYLRAPKDCGATREDLEGQPLVGMDTVERIAKTVGGAVRRDPSEQQRA